MKKLIVCLCFLMLLYGCGVIVERPMLICKNILHVDILKHTTKGPGLFKGSGANILDYEVRITLKDTTTASIIVDQEGLDILKKALDENTIKN